MQTAFLCQQRRAGKAVSPSVVIGVLADGAKNSPLAICHTLKGTVVAFKQKPPHVNLRHASAFDAACTSRGAGM